MSMRKKIGLVLKTIVVLISMSFIGIKLYSDTQNNDVFAAFRQINTQRLLLLIPSFVMVFINWGIETYKWQYIIKKIQPLPYKKCIKAVLAGITVAIFTPNRVGEFGGRILALERKNRIAGVFATLLGGYAQLLITLIVGAIAFPIYFKLYPSQFESFTKHNLLFAIAIVVILIALFVFFKIKFFALLFEKFIKNSKKKRFVHFLSEYKSYELLKILFLSLVRYLVFTSQFLLLLYLFGINISFVQGIISIGLVYFLMSIVPVISMFEFGVRGTIAIMVLGIFSTSTLGIIAATLLLYIINLAIPATVGSIALYKLKL